MTRSPGAVARSALRILLACSLSLWFACGCFAGEPLGPGKAIYISGGVGLSPPVGVVVNGTAVVRAQKAFACAACHGTQGQGGVESGLRVPAIDWRTLTLPRPAGQFGVSRPAYDSEGVLRAVRSGIDASGAALGPAMPRYDLDGGQGASLTADRGVLGTADDSDPGISPDQIKLGTVLPMSGPLAEVGASIAAALQARFDEANATGGIYGRQVTLVVEDSGIEPSAVPGKLEKLIEQQGVFAIVSPLLWSDDPALSELLVAGNVPVVGPISSPPTEAQAKTSTAWHLQPTFYDQARVLVDEAYSARTAAFRAALIVKDAAQPRDAAAGARRQLDALSAPVVEITVDPDQLTVAGLAERIHDVGVTWVFVFGTTRQFERVAEAIATLPTGARPELGGLVALSPAPHLPPSIAATFAAATTPPNERQWRTLRASLERMNQPASRPAFQAIAYASACVLVEGITRAGRLLGRAAVIKELGLLRNFETGVMSAVSFTPNRRVGVRSSSIVRMYDQGALHVPFGGIRSPVE